MMVNVGKMFVCMETVVRVARRASAAAGSVARSVRAMVSRLFYFGLLAAIHVDLDFLGQRPDPTRAGRGLRRFYGSVWRATRGGIGR